MVSPRFRRRISIGILTVFIAMVMLSGTVSPARAAGSTVHMSLALDTSERAIQTLASDAFHKGNMRCYGVTEENLRSLSGRLELTAKVTASEDSLTLSGHGVAVLGPNTFPIDFDGSLKAYSLGEDRQVYWGPLPVVATTHGDQEEGLLGLYYDPANPDAGFAGLTVGDIDGDKGTALLLFGAQPAELDTIHAMMAAPSTASPASEVVVQATSNYNYQNTTYSKSIGNSNGYREGEPSSYTSASDYVFVMNAWSRNPDVNGNGSGSAQVRVFTRSSAVEAYAASAYTYPGATAWGELVQIGLRLSDSGSGINITTAGPADSSTSLGSWQFYGFIPKVGSFLQVLANYIDASSASVSAYRKIDSSTGRCTYLEKKIYTTMNAGDYSGAVTDSMNQTSGGVTASFDYLEYLSGTGTLTSTGRITYGAYVNYYIFLRTPQFTLSWSANFLT